MTQQKILILSKGNDAHTQRIGRILEKRGILYSTFVFEQFPDYSAISVTYRENDEPLVTLTLQDRDKKYLEPIILNDYTAVWNRRPSHPRSYSAANKNLYYYINDESFYLLKSLQHLLPRVKWFQDHETVASAVKKPYQLYVAQQIGLQTPATYIGNNPKDAAQFAQGKLSICMKPVNSGWLPHEETWLDHLKLLWTKLTRQKHETDMIAIDPAYDFLYSKRLTPKEFESVLPDIPTCPVILQDYIEKKLELRITIVGEKVFPCAIQSQAMADSTEDFRKLDNYTEQLHHSIYDLPAEIEEKCIQYVKAMGLEFGCIDMIVTPNDEYYFLEINPNGAWGWVERKTGMPIGEAMVDHMLQGNSTSNQDALENVYQVA